MSPRGRAVGSSTALPVVLACVLLVAVSGETGLGALGGGLFHGVPAAMSNAGTPDDVPQQDDSWDVGYADRWQRKHAFVNGLPDAEVPKPSLERLGESADDPFGVGMAHAKTQKVGSAKSESPSTIE